MAQADVLARNVCDEPGPSLQSVLPPSPLIPLNNHTISRPPSSLPSRPTCILQSVRGAVGTPTPLNVHPRGNPIAPKPRRVPQSRAAHREVANRVPEQRHELHHGAQERHDRIVSLRKTKKVSQ